MGSTKISPREMVEARTKNLVEGATYVLPQAAAICAGTQAGTEALEEEDFGRFADSAAALAFELSGAFQSATRKLSKTVEEELQRRERAASQADEGEG